MEELPVVVYSHLRWNSVFQRPQHLVTRLATQRLALFIEEPREIEDGGPDSWHIEFQTPSLRICTPLLGRSGDGFVANRERLEGMLASLLRGHEVERHLAWLYTPMAWPIARGLQPSLVVYDCMDELSGFLGAPPDMQLRERQLMRDADVVFTGGASLYRAKRALHPRVRCFPSSVDAEHFGPAGKSLPTPADQAEIPAPRLGFYGVLDERLDLGLLDAVARLRPDWQIVMVGPVAKIELSSLPRRPNLHYLGQRDFDELPGYLAGWDVCLLPFAHNAATRFISPTKTLEYMAAGKPIVSTRIADVASAYDEIVYLADRPAEFVTACERALHAPPEERAARAARAASVLECTSWDRTIEAMSRELRRAAVRKQAAPRARRAAGERWLDSPEAP